MSQKVVLDASALLALLQQEPGYHAVEEVLPTAIMSSVNISEVLTILMRIGIADQAAREIAMDIVSEIVPFDLSQAYLAALLNGITRLYGLSFGDRACLALAKSYDDTYVLTADKVWGQIAIPGLKIQLIR